jgi:hypothetical protein
MFLRCGFTEVSVVFEVENVSNAKLKYFFKTFQVIGRGVMGA